MRLLVVSHACVTPINQQFFAVLEEQTGWNITLVAPARWKNEYGEERHLKRWPAFQGELVPVPVWGSGNVPLHIYRSFFVSLLRRTHPDVIYMHHEPYAAATAQMYLANRFSLNRPIGFFTWQNIYKKYPPPFGQLERMVFRQSQFAISGSESASRVLREKGYEGPLDIIPAGIDPELYRDKEDEQFTLRQSSEDVVIGYVGRIAEEKGLATLLEALEHIKEKPWRLVVVGAGSYEKQFDEKAAILGLTDRVERVGYVPHTDAPRYLSAFDALAIPSETQVNWKEQFGRVIIEAMACGTPVVGSDSGEIPHLIQRTQGGWIFPEREAQILAEQLATVIDQPAERSQRAHQGRQYVLEHYTHAALADRFAHTVREAV